MRDVTLHTETIKINYYNFFGVFIDNNIFYIMYEIALINIYTADIPPPSAPVTVMAYADDITITSKHTSTSAAKKYIQP